MIIRSPKTKEEWIEYYTLRYQILRKPLGQPVGSEKNEGDETAEHFALFDNNKIIAISRADVIDFNTIQIRFFAVDEQHQGKGYGKELLTTIEKWAINNKYAKIILQARENAVSFYEKNGYHIKEKTHLLFGKIQHYLMKKVL